MSRERHPSELTWARALAAELGWLARARLRRHLAACEACRCVEANMAEDRGAFESDPRYSDDLRLLLAGTVTAPPPGAPRRASRLAVAAAGAALVAVLAVVATLRPTSLDLAPKGRDAFQLFVDGSGGARPLGGRCAQGDRIIVLYRTDRPYLLLLERDGRGRVQTLVPRDGVESARLPKAAGTTPDSWILDAEPGPECFVAVFSDKPVGVAAATRALFERPEAPALRGATIQIRCCEKGGGR
jgi:hypothetical protein